MLKSKILTLAAGTVVAGAITFSLIGAHNFIGGEDLQKAKANIAAYKTDVENTIDNLKELITEKNKIVGDKDDNISNLVSQIENLKVNSESAEKEKEQLLNKAKELEKTLEDTKDDSDYKNKRIEILNNEKNKYISIINENTVLSKEKDKTIKDLLSEKDNHVASIKDLTNKISSLQKDSAKKDMTISDKEDFLKGCLEEIEQLKNEIDKDEAKIKELEGNSKTSDNNMKAQQDEMKKANNNIDTANKACKDFANDTSKLKAPSIADVK